MLDQKNAVKFTSEDKKITLICDTDTPLGNIHDFLMFLKGMMVEKMLAAQKEEEEVSKKLMEEQEPTPCVPCE